MPAGSNRPVACRNAGEEPTALLSAPPSEANTCTHGNKDSLGSDAEAVEAEHRWSGRCPRAHGDASLPAPGIMRLTCVRARPAPLPSAEREAGRPMQLRTAVGSQLVVGAYSRDITANLATSFRAMIGSAFPTVAQPGQ